jgi:predicted metal-dependent enzyme (double-stranded beta helix superfamily)
MANLWRLKFCVRNLTELVNGYGGNEAKLLQLAEFALADLIAQDDWLPDDYAQPDPVHYRQYLLYADPLDRFSVVSFVWGPGQSTPIHDHTVWGLIGVLRGGEICTSYNLSDAGLTPGVTCRLNPGMIDAVSPRIGDIHKVSNAFEDRTSISIHVYGGDIGAIRRHVFDPVSGQAKPFTSHYSNSVLPNLWGHFQGETS